MRRWKGFPKSWPSGKRRWGTGESPLPEAAGKATLLEKAIEKEIHALNMSATKFKVTV